MLRLEDVMQRDVVAVAPELTLRELLEVLIDEEVRGAPVLADRRVVGVISTTDVLEFQEDTEVLKLRRGTPESEPVEPADAMASPADFFSETWDESGAAEWLRADRGRETDLLDEYTVGDLMTRDILSRPSNTSVNEAARYMLNAGVHRLLVIDDGELQGIVTTTDIVRAVAEGKLKG